MRQYIQDNPEHPAGDSLVMHMDFQCAVQALPEAEQNEVVNALRKLKPLGWSAKIAATDHAPGLFSIHLAAGRRAVAGRDGDRMFLLALE